MPLYIQEKPQPKLEVLDHGYVRLVDWMGDDQAVVRSARVSYNAKPRNDGSDEKLIRYLYRNAHTSPFEAVTVTFEVKAPIFVLRQWHRHRTWSYNEVSARYTELPEEFYVPELDQITTQSSSNKQMRTDEANVNADVIRDWMTQHNEDAFRRYKRMLLNGCPRELARTILPVATYSTMFATVDLHNLMHFLRLRLHEHAQHEIQVYAQAMRSLVAKHVAPVCMKAFDEGQNSG